MCSLENYCQVIIHVTHHQVKEQNIISIEKAQVYLPDHKCLLPRRGNTKPTFSIKLLPLPLAHLKNTALASIYVSINSTVQFSNILVLIFL